MGKALQFTSRFLCLLAVAVAAIISGLTACFICLMGIIQMNDGRLPSGEKQAVERAASWFLGSFVIVCVGWWLGGRVGGTADDSLRLVRSTTGKGEKLPHPLSQFFFFIISALWLWAVIPGSAATRVATVIGWLLVGYFGLHLRLILHELAHLGAARWVGFYLKKCRSVTGPALGFSI